MRREASKPEAPVQVQAACAPPWPAPPLPGFPPPWLSTWDLEVEVAGAANGGNGRSLSAPGDTFLHASLTSYLHGEGASCEGEEENQGHGSPA